METFEYILLGLVVVLIGLVIYLLILFNRKKDDTSIQDNSELKVYMQKEFGEFKTDLADKFGGYSKENQKDLSEFKDKMMKHIEEQMSTINQKVEERLGKGFEATNKTFVDVVQRLTKIDEAQKKIETLSTEVVDLSNLLSDKKSRGTFGEVQLYTLLEAVMGNNNQLYETQKKLSTGVMVDAMIHAPQPLGDIAVDSKFPLENYQRMVDRNIGAADRANAERDFKRDLKKHIDDIASKYIIPDVTAEQAFMFIPAEAIFAEITAYHEDIITYSQKKNVWLVSPTTLISTLTTIITIVKNIERDKQTSIILEELRKLGEDFNRYQSRWDKLSRSIETVSKDAQSVSISTQKISKRFDYISDAKFDELITADGSDDEDEERLTESD